MFKAHRLLHHSTLGSRVIKNLASLHLHRHPLRQACCWTPLPPPVHPPSPPSLSSPQTPRLHAPVPQRPAPTRSRRPLWESGLAYQSPAPPPRRPPVFRRRDHPRPCCCQCRLPPRLAHPQPVSLPAEGFGRAWGCRPATPWPLASRQQAALFAASDSEQCHPLSLNLLLSMFADEAGR